MEDIIEDIQGGSTVRRLARKGGAAAFVGLGTLALVAGPASAEPPAADPTGGGTTELTEGIQSWTTAYGVPMLVTLLVLGVVIALFLKFGKKAKSTIA